MVSQSSRNQHRKRIKAGDDNVANHGDDLEAAAACHDFLKEAPEDLLLEIFIRLPDSRSAIRTATVCHYWHSLISHNPRYIPRFTSHHHQHQHRYPLSYTIIFRKADDKPQFTGPQCFQPICKLFSDQESTFCTSPDFLDFIVPSSPMVIRGSCNDLLLVSPGSRSSTHLYICNPITKQFIQLPEIPRRNYNPDFYHWVVGHALVCMPGPTNKFRFKVLEFQQIRFPNSVTELPHHTFRPMRLFCSESRKWETRPFHYPQPTTPNGINWLHGVACNGILYWIEFERCEINRVIYLDLSNHQCGAIDFPDDYCADFYYARNQIGVVREHGREELRLLEVVLTIRKESTVDLKVWKLNHNDHSDKKEWVLVHHKNKLKKPNRGSYQALPFVHPTNGDVVFMVWERKVFQYSLNDTNTSTYELIGKLQQPLVKRTYRVAENDRLLQFPLVHMNWPTQILTWSLQSV